MAPKSNIMTNNDLFKPSNLATDASNVAVLSQGSIGNGCPIQKLFSNKEGVTYLQYAFVSKINMITGNKPVQ